MSATVDELSKFAEEGGFMFKSTPGDLCVIPSGFLTVSIGLDYNFGLRWALSSDEEDTRRVSFYLKELLSKYPELTNPSVGYAQWSAYLETL